jgi:amino acid transporter
VNPRGNNFIAAEEKATRLLTILKSLLRLVLYTSVVCLFILLNLLCTTDMMKKDINPPGNIYHFSLFIAFISFYMFAIVPAFCLILFTRIYLRYRKKHVPGFFRTESHLFLVNFVLAFMLGMILVARLLFLDISSHN